MCCISSVSYIKPQPKEIDHAAFAVVYRPFPTSNHNPSGASIRKRTVVYRPFPTSNHNCDAIIFEKSFVVYRPFPTSNHNRGVLCIARRFVVYRPFPTSNHNLPDAIAEIGTLYIVRFLHQTTTIIQQFKVIIRLYIVRFLHQTTTMMHTCQLSTSCISSVSYIKPQLVHVGHKQ